MKLVAEAMEISHPDLTEVSGMVLVEKDAVVVHASGVPAPAGMLSVLPYAAVPGTHVAALLPVLLESSRHGGGCRTGG